MEQISQSIVDIVRTHQNWGPPIVGLLAFGESLAVISLFVPATSILIGIGIVAAASDVAVLPAMIAGAIGAALGDWVSYWFGYRYGARIKTMPLLRNHPAALARGETFLRRWGAGGVFLGRFFGPLRAIVPLIAGVSRLGPLPFQLANWSSAIMWSALLIGGPSFGAGVLR